MQEKLVMTYGPALDGRMLAVITDRTPGDGYSKIVVLAVEPCATVKDARRWFARMKKERPWVARN